MATHVASDHLAGGDIRPSHQEPGGTSYAHAVLNFKNHDNTSNKENIHDTTQIRTTTKTTLQENPKETTEGVVDDGESFTPVVSHSRKERKNEKNRREKLKDNNHKPMVNGNSEKRDKEQSEREKEKDEEKEVSKPKVFVEAPLPKVNPWQVNRSAPQTVEKRVLQPQKQETTVNGQVLQTVVSAPKDRRKYNQKVSDNWFFKVLQL